MLGRAQKRVRTAHIKAPIGLHHPGDPVFDDETAAAMITNPSFDLATLLQPALTPITKQITISRGFVERKTRSGMKAIYIGGSLAQVPRVPEAIQQDVGVRTVQWSPLDALGGKTASLPNELTEAPWRFTAAIGTALGVLQPS